jgi:hypothetical protein
MLDHIGEEPVERLLGRGVSKAEATWNLRIDPRALARRQIGLSRAQEISQFRPGGLAREQILLRWRSQSQVERQLIGGNQQMVGAAPLGIAWHLVPLVPRLVTFDTCRCGLGEAEWRERKDSRWVRASTEGMEGERVKSMTGSIVER